MIRTNVETNCPLFQKLNIKACIRGTPGKERRTRWKVGLVMVGRRTELEVSGTKEIVEAAKACGQRAV